MTVCGLATWWKQGLARIVKDPSRGKSGPRPTLVIRLARSPPRQTQNQITHLSSTLPPSKHTGNKRNTKESLFHLQSEGT